MGYDCTLHLIDEKAIREEFIPKLLGQSRQKTALERVYEDEAPKHWQTARRALAAKDPDAAAALVCQLAVMFSACSLPHQYQRGFALSLWFKPGKGRRPELPEDLMFSPEPLFADVVKKYPRLKRRFPTWFMENYSTGVFIPSEHVPRALAWAEKRIAKFNKGEQRQYKGLLGILRAAADQGYAYWEATDLAVPMAGRFPGDPSLMLAKYLGNEPAAPAATVEETPVTGHLRAFDAERVGTWLVSGDTDPFVTSFWDLSQWPPKLKYSLDEFAKCAAQARDGRWLLLSETEVDAKPRVFRPRLFKALNRACAGDIPVAPRSAELYFDGCGFVGERLVVFLRPHHSAKPGDLLQPPLWLEGDQWKPVPGLAAVKARRSPLGSGVENLQVGVVNLADGQDVLIWNGNGYELKGQRFRQTFTMESKWTYIFTGVPAGKDGFFYLSANSQLFEVHRGAKPIAHAPQWKIITEIGPGPAGSVLVREGNNPDGDLGKLYFPADGTFIHLEPSLFDDNDHGSIYWSEQADRFIMPRNDRFLAIRTAAILALPRHPVGNKPAGKKPVGKGRKGK